MSNNKILLSISFIIINSSFAYASETNPQLESPITINRFIAQNNFNNDFSASLNPGSTFCRVFFGQYSTCMPVINGSNNSLHVDFHEVINRNDKPIKKFELSSYLLRHSSEAKKTATVKNLKTGKIIYEGDIFNKVGLACYEDHCIKWDRNIKID